MVTAVVGNLRCVLKIFDAFRKLAGVATVFEVSSSSPNVKYIILFIKSFQPYEVSSVGVPSKFTFPDIRFN